MTDENGMVIGSASYGGPTPNAALNGFPVQVIRRGDSRFVIVSNPYPLHRASVTRRITGRGWMVTFETASVRVKMFDSRMDMLKALRHAASHVAALYRVDMRAKFSGYQRFMMGRNLCPAKVPCPIPDTCPTRGGVPIDKHFHYCKAVPDGPLTVWCEKHTAQSWNRPGEAFRSLDEGTPTEAGDPG